jgi:hypothetical protein
MGAWVTAVIHDLFHNSEGVVPQPTPRTADVTRTGNAIAGGSHGR